MNAAERDWSQLRIVLILLSLFSFCLYLPSIFHEAFADDDLYLAFTNRFLRAANWSDLYQLFLRPANPIEFLPVRDFTYWLDFRLYDGGVTGFHVTNLLWYAACGLAAFWLLRELVVFCRADLAVRATLLALCGALLFIVHPAHVEVVAWIASRKDLLAGTFGLLALALLVRAMRGGWSARQLAVVALLLVLACFSKAAAITFVLVMTVLIGAGRKHSPEVGRWKKVGWLLFLWALVVAAVLIHMHVGESTGIRIVNHPGWLVVIERASRIFSASLGMLLCPYRLRFYYDVYLLGDWHWLVSAGAASLLLVALRALWRQPTLWAIGIVLMFAPLAVYLQLIPFTTWSLASERFVFVSVVGLSLLLVDMLGRISRPQAIGGLMLLIVLPSAALVWARIGDWGDTSSLLPREYQLQPGFHNAMRDRIVFTLLTEKRYVEAAALARQVPRPYAAEALLALVNTEHAFREMSDGKSDAPTSEKEALQQGYCRAVTNLRAAAEKGYAQIPAERDLSYNNILRTVDKQLKFQYAGSQAFCAANTIAPGR